VLFESCRLTKLLEGHGAVVGAVRCIHSGFRAIHEAAAGLLAGFGRFRCGGKALHSTGCRRIPLSQSGGPEYPQLSREDIQAALLYAAESAKNTLVA